MLPRIGITSSSGMNGERPAAVLNRAYVDAVAGVGGLPIVVPTLDPALAVEILETIDALVLSGGGDVDPATYGEPADPTVQGVDPRRDAWEIALVRAAVGRGIPVLGVCRGAQLLNVACGGTLVQHLPSITEQVHRASDRSGELVHDIELDAGSKLAETLEAVRIGANTLHHQAVAEVGAGLRAVAWSEDGTVEAIETDDARPVLAVQWHPEHLTEHPTHRRLFAWMVREAQLRAAAPPAADDDDLAVA